MIGKFHSKRSEKVALIAVSVPFVFGQTFVFVPLNSIPADKQVKDAEFTLPNLRVVDLVNFQTGEVIKSADGSPLKTLAV